MNPDSHKLGVENQRAGIAIISKTPPPGLHTFDLDACIRIDKCVGANPAYGPATRCSVLQNQEARFHLVLLSSPDFAKTSVPIDPPVEELRDCHMVALEHAVVEDL